MGSISNGRTEASISALSGDNFFSPQLSWEERSCHAGSGTSSAVLFRLLSTFSKGIMESFFME